MHQYGSPNRHPRELPHATHAGVWASPRNSPLYAVNRHSSRIGTPVFGYLIGVFPGFPGSPVQL